MRKLWCWWRSRVELPASRSTSPRPVRQMSSAVWLLAALALVSPPVAGAATILEKNIRHAVQPDGSVLEGVELRVRLESERDLEAWSIYPLYLDDHRTLVEISTSAVRPDGKEVVVRNKDHDVSEYPGAAALAGSQRYRLVEFPALPVGSEIRIAHTVRETPYFPANHISLGEDDPIASLNVEITGATGLRWQIDPDTRVWGDGALRLDAADGSLRIRGEGLPAAEVPEMAPADSAEGPVLFYTWGDPDVSWRDVAAWYQRLLDGLPASSPEVSRQAQALIAGISDRRQRLEALLEFARQKVRYVAVEMGIGGWQPSPPPETLERGWGDCKDKAILLSKLLGEAGIPSYPVLILSGRDERIDPDIPNPFQFNHAIVAVPVDGLETREGDPVADGLLFLDPTHEKGTSHWLHSAVQDQDALVVRGEASALVRTPALYRSDRRELVVDLVAGTASGAARGAAQLELSGRFGAVLIELLAGEKTDRIEETLRSILGRVLPGATVSQISWGQDLSDGVPWATIHAQVEIPGLLLGSGERLSLTLPGVPGTPQPALLEERTLPVVVSPGVVRESWRITLPPGWCPQESQPSAVANDLGSFLQTVDGGDGGLTVERILQLDRRWVEAEEAGALRELSLAELRARKRRIRLGGCAAGPGSF